MLAGNTGDKDGRTTVKRIYRVLARGPAFSGIGKDVYANQRGEALSCIETDRPGSGKRGAGGKRCPHGGWGGDPWEGASLAPTLGQGLAVLLLGDVQVVHVGRVVLAVVQLHDLRVDVRLQRAVVVGQVRKAVLVPAAARGTRRRRRGQGQPPARAEGDTEDAASRHRHREPAHPRRPGTPPHIPRGTPRPRAPPLTCTPPDTTC